MSGRRRWRPLERGIHVSECTWHQAAGPLRVLLSGGSVVLAAPRVPGVLVAALYFGLLRVSCATYYIRHERESGGNGAPAPPEPTGRAAHGKAHVFLGAIGPVELGFEWRPSAPGAHEQNGKTHVFWGVIGQISGSVHVVHLASLVGAKRSVDFQVN
jgi:hypothetical protein